MSEAVMETRARGMTREERKVIFASSLGTVFEWYDFYIYGTLGAILAGKFFSGVNPTAGFIFTLLAFAAGFAVRPFGALIFGRIGDLALTEYTARSVGRQLREAGVTVTFAPDADTAQPLVAAFTTSVFEPGGRPVREGLELKVRTKPVYLGVKIDQGEAGDNIGALLRGVERDGVERGQVLAKPGTVKPHKKFKAEVYILTKEEGGRHTPFFKGYRPQFYFRTTDVTGLIELPGNTEMVMPGDNIKMTVELIAPIAMEEGLRFAIREGGRTVGAGVVSKILK